MLGSYDAVEGPLLFMVDPSGMSWVSCIVMILERFFISPVLQGYKGVAIGKAKQAAKTELEKLKVIHTCTLVYPLPQHMPTHMHATHTCKRLAMTCPPLLMQ